MNTRRLHIVLALGFAVQLTAHAGQGTPVDSTAAQFAEAGFLNVRAAETDEFRAFSLETDYYKLPFEGLAAVREMVERDSTDMRLVKIVATSYDVPELTMTYNPRNGQWRSTRRLDESWDLLRRQEKLNSNFGKVNIVVYPQVSLMNLIITQVYQSLWQLSPALEVSLWPGMKFTYQLQIPVYNDGYGALEDKVHPGFFTLSQRFRDPWNLNVLGKLTAGVFSNSTYGLALEMAYYFPNERFWLDTQLGLLGNSYWEGFIFHYDPRLFFRWNLAVNYYWPEQNTQFSLRAQRFLVGDYGVKYEMIRHFRRASVGLYAEKSLGAPLNVGFRFQVALPLFRQKRHGWWPKLTTSGQMGMAYNANNERYYYNEYRTEASDNILSKNYYNPYFIDSKLR